MAPLILDHLWQSTVLALGLGLLAVMFRRAPAGVRHGLWLSASVKFLVPFALLAALGRLIGPAIPLPAEAKPEAAFIAQAAQPFSRAAPVLAPRSQPEPAPQAAAPAPRAEAPVVETRAAPRLDVAQGLLVAWALGSVAVLIAWAARWAELRKVLRSARRLDWSAPMPVLAAPSLVEPGLVGLWRPVLLVPETLPERLSRSEIDALLAHEACHLRRGDNVAAALHMLVEALFWFHPLVWRIGARLIEERERACDEAVVKAGHDRAAYARTLVEICRHYLQSPLDCVAGASGSDLKTRVEAIMNAPPASPLSRAGKALLLAAGVFAFATPVAAGLLTTPAAQKAVARAAAIVAKPASAPASDGAPPARFDAPSRNEIRLAPGQSDQPINAVIGALPKVSLPNGIDAPAPGASPGTEAAVRNWILALQTHQPALAKMSPEVERSARGQWPLAEQMFRSFGGLKGLTFVRATPDGDDAYQVDFAHARIQVIVGPLTTDGGLSRLAWGPLWTQAGGRPAPKTPLAPDGMPQPLYCWCARASSDGPAPAVSLGSGPTSITADTMVRYDQAHMFRWSGNVEIAFVGDLKGARAKIPVYLDGRPAPDIFDPRGARFAAVEVKFADGADLSPMESISFFTYAAAPPDPAARPAAYSSPSAPARLPLTLAASQPASAPSPVGTVVRSFGPAFWNQDDPICIRVEGLPSAKAAAVKGRVEADARAVGVSVGRAECGLRNEVEIRFSSDADRAVDEVLNYYHHPIWPFPLARPTGADRPIKAFYGMVYDHAAAPDGHNDLGRDPSAGVKLSLAIVVVDPARTQGLSLDVVSDYVALLALAQPSVLDRCNVLPTIADLFAGACPGRPAPTGLTAFDAAYLKALYKGSPGIRASRYKWELVDRVAKAL